MSFMSFGIRPCVENVPLLAYKEICEEAHKICARGAKLFPVEDFIYALSAGVGDAIFHQVHGTPRIPINAGQAFFFPETMVLLKGDPDRSVQNMPLNSVFGRFMHLTADMSFCADSAPSLTATYNYFKNNHDKVPFGFAPISPESNVKAPSLAPLEMAFQLREVVAEAAQHYHKDEKGAKALLATHALAYGVRLNRGIIPPALALNIIFPTILGLAHLSPIIRANRSAANSRMSQKLTQQAPSFP